MKDTTTPASSPKARLNVERLWLLLWNAVRPRIWQIAFVGLALIFAVVVVRPWMPSPPDPNAVDISRQWNESIAKLGIEPIFPPQENVYVGDIYAILTDVDKSVDRTFLGSSVLIGHANMRWAYHSKDRDTPLFAATKTGVANEAARQDATEIDVPEKYKDNLISLSLAAFPGVTITHAFKSAAKLGLGTVGANADRGNTQLEQIHIPVAETYGVSPPDAVATLDFWCSAADTKKRCTRDFAMNMLAYVAGDAFMRRKEGQSEPRVALLMISRVYVAREFDIQRTSNGKAGGSLAAGSAFSQESGASASANKQPKSATVLESGVASSSMAGSQEFSQEQGLKQVFQRPVVFGYLSVKRGLSE